MSKQFLVVSILFVLVFINAIVVIYVKQQSRDLYSDIRVLQKKEDALTINWSRLQLQSSTLTNAAYVEKFARKNLGMQTVRSPKYVLLK